MKRLILEPPNSEAQKEFFRSRAKYTAYGGARGGGKSWAVRHKSILLAARYPGIRILTLRRTYPELQQNHILPMMTLLAGTVPYKETEKSFKWPNGSLIHYGYCDREADVLQYQGQEWDVIFLDEATHFTEWQYQALTACVRGTNAFPKRMYLTCNPGGVGHAWVKRLFIDRSYEPGENPADYRFIQALVYDNATLMEKQPDYVKQLEALPEKKRRAWLLGDWSVVDGAFFTEWRRDVHVIEPIAIPAWWKRYACMDYGFDKLAAYLAAMDEEGTVYVTREVYQSGLLIDQAAAAVRAMIGQHKVEAVFGPPDMWNRQKDTGRSFAEACAAQGVYLTRASNDRVMGWAEVRRYLHWEDETLPDGGVRRRGPKLFVFSGCTGLIESFPYLLHDAHRPDDVAKEPHQFTHGPDAIRYLLAGRPLAAEQPGEPETDVWGNRVEYDDQEREFLEYGI